MFTYSAYVRLRYQAILCAISQICAAWVVRGRQNDPLQNATWMSHGYHSAVLVAAAGTILGTALFYLLLRLNASRPWSNALLGAAVGMFPGLFYQVATPSQDLTWVPTDEMILKGALVGLVVGLISYFVTKKEQAADGPNKALERTREG